MTTQIVVIQPEQGHTQNTDDYLDYGGASQVAASALKAVVDAKDTDGTLAANSDSKYATQKAVKTYADTKLAASYLDTDATLTANSDVKVPSQKAVKTYVDLVAKRSLQVVVIDYTTPCVVGDGAAYFRVPDILNSMVLSAVAARCITAGVTGTMDIQIRNVTDSVDMLSTKMTIDSGEYDTITAATPAVIDTSHDDVATGDLIAFDIDAIHSGTAAQGLLVVLTFSKA